MTLPTEKADHTVPASQADPGPTRTVPCEGIAFIAWMTIAALVVVALWFWWVRSAQGGFVPVVPPASGLGIALAYAASLIGGPLLLLSSGSGNPLRLFASVGLLLLLLALPVLAWWSAPVSFWREMLSLLVLAAALAMAGSVFLRAVKRGLSSVTGSQTGSDRIGAGRLAILSATFCGALLAIAIATSQVDGGYVQPLTLERSLVGAQHHDTLFHAAIANMLVHYQVASTGIDGTVPIGYHVLSHLAIGAFADWLQLPVLLGYSQFTLLILLPVMFLSFMIAGIALVKRHPSSLKAPVRLVLMLALVLLSIRFFGGSSLNSESYGFSLIFFLLAIGVQTGWNPANGTVVKTGRVADFLVLCLIAILVAGASLSKISTGAVLACGMVFAITARLHFKPSGFLLAALFGILPFVLAFLSVEAGDGAPIRFSLFNYFGEYTRSSVTCILIGGMGCYFCASYALKNRSDTVVPGMLVVMILAAVTSSQLLELPAGAAGYFANPAIWAGCLAIVGYGPVHAGFAKLSQRSQILVALTLLFVAIAVDQGRWTATSAIIKDKKAIASRMDGAMMYALATMPERPTAGDRTLVHVPADRREFWDGRMPCWSASFQIPAILGVPMIGGLPPTDAGCEVTPYYGFNDYQKRLIQSSDNGEVGLCEIATRLGFERVFVIGSAAKGQVLECKSGG